MAVSAHHPPIPACPRCGYDLAGVIDSWRDACPLEGTCSECGLEWEWSRVLNPRLAIPLWLIENPYRPVTRTLIPTVHRSLRPWSMWRTIRIECPIDSARVLRLGTALLIAVHLLALGLIVWPFVEVAAAGVPYASAGPFKTADTWRDLAWKMVWPYAPTRVYSWRPFVVAPFVTLGLVLWYLAAPLGYLLLSDTFRMIRVRFAHLRRAFGYSLIGLAAGLLAGELLYARDLVMDKWSPGGWHDDLADQAGWAWGLSGLWLCVHWVAFTVRYLRLPHAGGAALAMLLLSGLLASVASALAFLVWYWLQ